MMTRLLFAGSVTCFFAVLWVVLALARKVRRNEARASKVVRSGPPWEFFEAGEFRTPRPLRLTQELPRRPLSEISFPAGQLRSAPQSQGLRSSNPDPTSPISLFGVGGIPRPANRPAQGPASRYTASPATLSATAVQPSQIRPVYFGQQQADAPRKPPQSATRSGMRQVDLSLNDQERSDLADPYMETIRDLRPSRGAPAPGWLPKSG
jgi:hypothetical protein